MIQKLINEFNTFLKNIQGNNKSLKADIKPIPRSSEGPTTENELEDYISSPSNTNISNNSFRKFTREQNGGRKSRRRKVNKKSVKRHK